MTFTPNNWNAIRAFYRDFNDLILAAPVNEWAADPYEWDTGIIFMTPIEAWFWADIRANDAVLYPQYPVLDFFVDFANPRAKVAIECDGAAYHTDKVKDEERDKRLADAGWAVYRISGSNCRLESDYDTGAPSVPYLFIQRICEKHGISRKSQWPPTDRDDDDIDDDFEPMSVSIDKWWAAAQAARNRKGKVP